MIQSTQKINLSGLNKTNIAKAVSFSGILLAIILFAGFMAYKAYVLKSDVSKSIYPEEIINSINTERGKENLPALSPNVNLTEAAMKKAEDMAREGYFAHNSPDGETPWQFMEESGYYFLYAGENLAVDFFDVDEVSQAWMDSPGHRENILNIDFSETGIGVAPGTYQGREVLFYVQMFGRPMPVPQVVSMVSEGAGQVLGASTEQEIGNLANVSGANVEGAETSLFTKLFSNPGKLLRTIYFSLTAILLLVAISSAIFSSGIRKNLSTISFSLSSVIIIWGLFYVYSTVTLLV